MSVLALLVAATLFLLPLLNNRAAYQYDQVGAELTARMHAGKNVTVVLAKLRLSCILEAFFHT